MNICNVPPEGWYCTRESGHEGPCAAWPVVEGGSADLTDDALLCIADENDYAEEDPKCIVRLLRAAIKADRASRPAALAAPKQQNNQGDQQ